MLQITLWCARGLYRRNWLGDPWGRPYYGSRIVNQLRRDCHSSGPCRISVCTSRMFSGGLCCSMGCPDVLTMMTLIRVVNTPGRTRSECSSPSFILWYRMTDDFRIRNASLAKPHPYKTGDSVLLSTKNVNLNLPCKKLSPEVVGPFTIRSLLGTNVVCLCGSDVWMSRPLERFWCQSWLLG